MGCHDEVQATHGTPLAGTTLLHMCVDYDEFEIAEWLLAQGMPVDTPATVNARASLRKQLHPGYGPDPGRAYHDVTPLGWGRRFHRRVFVSEPAMALIAERGGHE